MPFLTSELVDVWRCYIDVALFILIWLVQLIIYPSFAHVRESTFIAWHHQYTGLISLFVAPLMFGQSGIYLLSVILYGRWHDSLGGIGVLVVWISTLCLSVPCHDRLHRSGYDLPTIKRLVHTNWIRTVAWTIILGIDLATISPAAFLR